jgi:hypothetical protein
MTRGELKKLIKECLVEILLDGSDVSTVTEVKKRVVPSTGYRQVQPAQQMQAKQKADSAAKNAISLLTKDPTLSSILADTAKTTLQEQLNAEGPLANVQHRTMVQESMQQQASEENDPFADMLAGKADLWSALAFSDKKGV